ncbi:MAG TPA: aldo/keto reductase [Dongiaceae bacterium]|jgi:aryl-alcohol dehydrogenase-like predicted oxidoreductase|nr:aldo/keto reductase [Dongiaceae bacterium]
MEYRLLGRSGLKVSALTLGTMTFGGESFFAKTGNIDVAGARRIIDLYRDVGGNLIDTADVYSHGRSEEIIGEALGGKGQDLMIATKARFPMGPGLNDRGLSRQYLIKACEASLKRLRRETIDLYQMHEWDGQTPIEETMEALDSLQRAGKVRYIGCSNFSGWHIMKALAAADARHQARFVSQQIYYSLQARDAEYELLPIAVDQGVGILVWSPLAGGLLSGKYRRGKPMPEGRHLADWGEPPIHDEKKLYDTIEVLLAIAEARRIAPAQVALAWLLGRPGVSSVVIGARNETQLKENLPAGDLKLNDEETGKLDAVSAPTLLYPYWHQVNTASDRLGEADLALLRPFLKKDLRLG